MKTFIFLLFLFPFGVSAQLSDEDFKEETEFKKPEITINKGMNKFQRINHLEKKLISLYKKVESLEKRIKKLESRKNKEEKKPEEKKP